MASKGTISTQTQRKLIILSPLKLRYEGPSPLIDEYAKQITYCLYLYNRMYSNTEKTNKINSKITIFEIAEKIKDEIDGQSEAANIMNAYRKVQNMSLPSNQSNNTSKRIKQSKNEPRKPESQYANKVKQTLKQLNANRKKELEANKVVSKPIANEKINGLGSAERHLIQSGLKKLAKILSRKYEQNIRYAISKIQMAGVNLNKNYEQRLRVWKLKRIFAGWSYQTMLIKIQKQRVKKEEQEKQRRRLRLAIDFHYFCTMKKIFKSWSRQIKRMIKKRQLQFQQSVQREREKEKNRFQQMDRLKKDNENRKQGITNNALQQKLRGFLDGLKQQIQGRQRLNTIKEKTQQSRLREEEEGKEKDSDLSSNGVQRQHENQISSAENEQAQERQADISINERQEHQNQGPLTNQELEKKRKQIQKKSKQRKEMLEKIKKQREEKRKKQQQQKIAIEKQIEQEQKKIRTEQYRNFVKQRKQEQQWKQKQKQLTRQAVQFDRLRVMKFYGWIQWSKLKKSNEQKADYIGKILMKIVMRRKLTELTKNVIELGTNRLEQQMVRAMKLNNKNTKKKCIQRLLLWKSQELQTKQELVVRHQINIIKIFFAAWKRVRNDIQLQNYDWERPRRLRAEALHSLNLMSKSFEAMKINRDEQIQNRNIKQQMIKIKQKVHSIVEEKPTIDYDQFL